MDNYIRADLNDDKEVQLNLIRMRLESVDCGLDQIRSILLYQAGLVDEAEFREKFDRSQDRSQEINSRREGFLTEYTNTL